MEYSKKVELAELITKIAAELTGEELQRAMGYIEGILAFKKINEKQPA